MSNRAQIANSIMQYEFYLDRIHEEHLRATDPERYEEYMRSRTPLRVEGEVVARIYLDPETGKLRFEGVKEGERNVK